MSTKIITKPMYVPHSIPIGEAIKNVTSRTKLSLRIKGQSEEELAANISQRGPESTSKDLRPGDEHDGSFMVLPIDKILPYDRNPRTSTNPKYNEIKASIRDRGGLQGNLTVTKRPGTTEYMLYMGGNTRLQILHELYAETGNKRFYQINCIYQGWKSEADIMASHLIENEARGDTLFIEKARGLMMLTKEIETSEGRSLTSREISSITAKMGMLVQHTIVLLFAFAEKNLDVLGPWLTQDNVNTIKRRYAQYENLAKTLNLSGEYQLRLSKAAPALMAAFAEDLKARAQTLNDVNSIIPLRGPVLDELLQRLDDLAADILKLNPVAAKRIFTAFSGKESLSADALNALIHGHNSDSDAVPPQAQQPVPSTNVLPPSKATTPKAPVQKATVATTASAVFPSPVGAEHNDAGQDVVNPASTSTSAEAMSDELMQSVSKEFADKLEHWCNLTHIGQWLRFSEDSQIPYLFWLELPPEILTSRDFGLWNLPDPELGVLTAEQLEIRAIGYRMIALLSGQLGGVIVTKVGKPTSYLPFALRLPEESTWRQAALIPFDSMDVLYNIWDGNLGGVTARTMDMSLAQDDLLVVLRNPTLVSSWMSFCQSYDKWGKCLHQYRVEKGITEELIDLQGLE